MTKDEIKAGDRINTPKGMGTVKYAFGGYLTVMLDNGEWWVSMTAILPKEDKPTYEIKVGDIVRVSDDAPKDIWRNRIGAVNPSHYKGLPFEVTQIYDGGLERMAHLDSTDGFMHIFIPVRFLKPYYSVEDVRRMEEELQREKEQHLRKHSGKDDKPNANTITIPVKADFGEDVGFALLDRALELQKKYTELEGDIRRLCDWVMGLKNNENPIICARFSNPHLKCICDAICDFRPLTEEERKQRDTEFMIMVDNLKKQSE